MGTYGSGYYGKGYYGGRTDTPPFSSVASPGIIEVYNPIGDLKGAYQVGSGIFLGVDFTLSDSGPKDFSLYFAGFADIDKSDLVKIKVFDNVNYFFQGVVRKTPIKGSSNVDYTYSGFGLSEYFDRLSTESQSYTSEPLEDIVADLVSNIIAVKSPINLNYGKIDAFGVTVNSIDFDYIQVSEALKQLKELAQSNGSQYRVGVDADGDFFFLPRSSEIIKNLVVGKNSDIGIPEYNPQDENRAKTKLFIKKKDGTFFGTVTSTEDNDVYEQTVTAPDIADGDLLSWATGILTEEEVNTRKASIVWEVEKIEPTFLKGDGRLRIISEIPATNLQDLAAFPFGSGVFGAGLFGGEQSNAIVLDDTLRVLEVSYHLSNNEAMRYIQLGLDDPKLELEVLDIRAELKDLKISLGV